jgi:8-oxo-dGTP diphosphatase
MPDAVLAVVAAAIVRSGRLLVVSKRSADHVFYLPGGKPEPGEPERVTLARELREELGVGLLSAEPFAVVEDVAALEGVPMRMTVLHATIDGAPEPAAEIAAMAWTDGSDDGLHLAPAVRNHVVPRLVAAGLLAAVPGPADEDGEDEDDPVGAATAGELRLLDPRVRVSRELVAELLHPEFVEFGASGRRWDAASVLEVMGGGGATAEPPISVSGLAGIRLAADVVHLTYVSDAAGRRARRSSVWRRDARGRWLLWFHQGTLTEDR